MTKREFPSPKILQFEFTESLEEQEQQLASNLLVLRMQAARRAKAEDPHRPFHHYVHPEYKLNDPNGLCFWQERWHLFYQVVPLEETRWHWAHAASDDPIHWRDLPYALCPGPEESCHSGTALVEEDDGKDGSRVIAMYHGGLIGNMVAVSRDPLLLN